MIELRRLIKVSSTRVLMGCIGIIVATQIVRRIRRPRSAPLVGSVLDSPVPATVPVLTHLEAPSAFTGEGHGAPGPAVVPAPRIHRAHHGDPLDQLASTILAGYPALRSGDTSDVPAVASVPDTAELLTSGGPAPDVVERLSSDQLAPESVGNAARGTLVSLTRWCIHHRRWVVAGWVALAIVVNVVVLSIGRDYRNDFSLPGTQAQTVLNLLKADFPAQSGDVDEVVFHYSDGVYNAEAVRSAVEPLLARISKLPYVDSVTSPFAGTGAVEVSKDGHTAFAVVHFTKPVDQLPDSAGEAVIDAVQTVHVPSLQVAAGGQAIEQAEGFDIGAATAVGVIAALVILLITFGSLITAGMPLISAGIGLLVGFALVGLSSQVASVAPLAPDMALMIGLGVGVDYALFIVTRFRENYARSGDIELAILEAMDTAGRAILLAGTTVIIALLGMIATGIAFMFGLAVASILGVLMVLLASLTVLPALLSWWGPKVVQPSRLARRRVTATGQPRSSAWRSWSVRVQAHPKLLTLVSLAVMLACVVPYFSARFEAADSGSDPHNSTTREAYGLISDGYGAGFNGPLQVAVELRHGTASQAALPAIYSALAHTDDVGAVTPPEISPNRAVAVYTVYPDDSPQAFKTQELVDQIRRVVAPRLSSRFAATAPVTVLVGGFTAASIDFANVLDVKLPLFIAIVVVLSALLLFVMFRSIIVPIQAGVMNLLSIGGAIGATVLVFQKGWLAALFGVTPGPIEPWIPVMLFAVVFGLSMDYEVFLISRVREEWVRQRDSSAAVADGIANTGRVITAAAAIMICVFLSFVLGDERAVKEFGFGLAVAVFLDAVVIRSVMLPALLELFGPWTWWLPRWVDRHLPHINIEGNSALAAEASRAAQRLEEDRRGGDLASGERSTEDRETVAV